MTPFKRLGLPQDADIPAIKRAYAKCLKQTRPDDDPQGFQRLHEAYQQALAAAEYRERYGDEEEDFDAYEDDTLVEPAIAEEVIAQTTESTTDNASLSPPNPPAASAPVFTAPYPETSELVEDFSQPADDDGEAIDAHHAATDEPEHDADVFHLHPFLQELHDVATDPKNSLKQWLERHPELYSLALKQAIVQPTLQALGEDFPPLRPKALEELLHYFQLDVVQRREEWIHWRVQYLREQSSEHWAMEAELWRLEHHGTPIERFILTELQQPEASWHRWLIALVPGLPSQAHGLAKRLLAANHQSTMPEQQPRFWMDFNDDGKLFLPRILSMFTRCLLVASALYLLAMSGGDTPFFPRMLAVICAPWLISYVVKLSAHALEHRTSGGVQSGWQMLKSIGTGLMEGLRSQSLARWLLIGFFAIQLLRACAALAS